MYHHPSKSAEKCSVFVIFEGSHDAVSKMCRLDSFFKVYRFRKLPAKMCRFRLNWRPVHNYFHRFQSVPTPCDRSLRLFNYVGRRMSKRYNGYYSFFFLLTNSFKCCNPQELNSIHTSEYKKKVSKAEYLNPDA